MQLEKANLIFARADYLESLVKTTDSLAGLYKAQYTNEVLINETYRQTIKQLKTKVKALKGANDVTVKHYKLLLKAERKKRIRNIFTYSLIGFVAGATMVVFIHH